MAMPAAMRKAFGHPKSIVSSLLEGWKMEIGGVCMLRQWRVCGATEGLA